MILVFWASWCGPCMEQVPHEVALAERKAGRPFPIVGVNMDRTLAAARSAVVSARIPSRNWCDLASNAPAPIMTLYHTQAVPAIYVLNGGGIIRFRDVHGAALDPCADVLLNENQARSSAASTKGDAAGLLLTKQAINEPNRPPAQRGNMDDQMRSDSYTIEST